MDENKLEGNKESNNYRIAGDLVVISLKVCKFLIFLLVFKHISSKVLSFPVKQCFLDIISNS